MPLADDVNPDEAVAVGAAIQAIFSLAAMRKKLPGEKMLPEDTRQQFSSREGGLIQVTNITSHTLGVVLWDEAHLEEYVFPMIRKMTRHAGDREEFIRHRQREHAAGDRADRGRRKHVAGRVHAARDLRRRVAAVSAERLAGRA